MSIVLTFVNADGIGLTLSLAAVMSRASVAPSAVMSAHRAVANIKASEADAQLASFPAQAAGICRRLYSLRAGTMPGARCLPCTATHKVSSS